MTSLPSIILPWEEEDASDFKNRNEELRARLVLCQSNFEEEMEKRCELIVCNSIVKKRADCSLRLFGLIRNRNLSWLIVENILSCWIPTTDVWNPIQFGQQYRMIDPLLPMDNGHILNDGLIAARPMTANEMDYGEYIRLKVRILSMGSLVANTQRINETLRSMITSRQERTRKLFLWLHMPYASIPYPS